VTHSLDVANKTKEVLPSLIDRLPAERKGFCEKVFSNYGGILLTASLNESIQFVNAFAPEHLELLVQEPMAILPKIQNAGEILLGKYTPITISNFSLGINAILPTGGFARSFSAVTVYDFLKRTSIGYLTREGYEKLANASQLFAEFEGFPAHAMAIRDRKV
jgi:histidinol dehydrogenase